LIIFSTVLAYALQQEIIENRPQKQN